MNLERKDVFIAVGVTVGAALIVLMLKPHNAASSGGNASTGGVDIMGGFGSAGTVYVPTTSEDITYNNLKDSSITYTTTTTNNQTLKTTTYAPVNSPINSPSGGYVGDSPVSNLVLPNPAPISGVPNILTGSNNVVNITTGQTNTTPIAPAPVAVTPPPPPPAPAVMPTPPPTPQPLMMGDQHWATPGGGWNPNSVVDYIKSKGGYPDYASRSILAGQLGIANYHGTAGQNTEMLHDLQRTYH